MELDTKVFVGNEREMYHRMAEWYIRPECEGLRAAWGPYPATQGALQAWPGFVAVTNAFLDDETHGRSGEPVAAEAELEPVKSSGATKLGTVVSAAEVGVITEEPSASEGHEGGRGSLEFLGLWWECHGDFLFPIKIRGHAKKDWQKGDYFRQQLRIAFGKLVDELVRNKVPSGILATASWTEPDTEGNTNPHWGIFWSASPDDESYQEHGLASMQADHQHESNRFVDFEGAVDDSVPNHQMAVYRVTLPSGGLDPWKWAGRPPPPAPEELYTGPRSDGLLSTGEISGDYSSWQLFGCCASMTVVPHGPDMIQTFFTGCVVFPCLGCIGPVADGGVSTRNPGTNAFKGTTFSADGTAKDGGGSYKKRPGSQKRAFHKVETRDLAGNWRGCGCVPFVPLWWLSHISCTTKKALNQDQYASTRIRCLLCLPIPYPCPCEAKTWTRKYVNGQPTDCFANDSDPKNIRWYRDPGCAGGSWGLASSFAKKIG